MRVRVDAGRQAKQDLLAHARFAGVFVDALKLFRAVDYEIADAAFDSVFYVEISLVVAVEEGALGREAGAERREQLARRNDVGTHALVGDDAVYLFEAERLRREKREGAVTEIFFHRVAVFARAGANAVFICQKKRGAVLFGKRDGVCARKIQAAVISYFDV